MSDWSRVEAVARDAIANTEYALTRPHVLMRPRLSLDGDQWCALYGSNLQNGVSGFGSTPALAMENFDKAWYALT